MYTEIIFDIETKKLFEEINTNILPIWVFPSSPSTNVPLMINSMKSKAKL